MPEMAYMLRRRLCWLQMQSSMDTARAGCIQPPSCQGGVHVAALQVLLPAQAPA
jgi:hypothetical protein